MNKFFHNIQYTVRCEVMNLNIKVFLGLLATLIIPTVANDYCDPLKVPCWGVGEHTMCVYPDDTPSSRCGQLWSKPLTDSEKEELLDVHNKWRDFVASGAETRSKASSGPMPQAANMGVMTWDDEIARIAQRLALRCKFGHDKCRNMHTLSVGQSIHLKGNSGKFPINLTEQAYSWYDTEVEKFDINKVDPFQIEVPTGHFSQYVWASSYKLGCGYTSYKTDYWTHYLVCDYGPAGNYRNNPMYKIGPPCSECPNGTTCGGDSRYPNLCNSDNGEVPPTAGPGIGAYNLSDLMTWNAAPSERPTLPVLLLAGGAALYVMP